MKSSIKIYKSDEGKYYKMEGKKRVEINRYQFAGLKRAMSKRDDKGRFVNKAIERKINKALNNMDITGDKKEREFIKKNYRKITSAPAVETETIWFNSADKRADELGNYKVTISINGVKHKIKRSELSEKLAEMNYTINEFDLTDDEAIEDKISPIPILDTTINHNKQTLDYTFRTDVLRLSRQLNAILRTKEI